MSETYRVGRHQAHNIYRVTAEHPEGVQIGCMFDPADGPLVVAALNAGHAEPVSELVRPNYPHGESQPDVADFNAWAADKRVLDAAEALYDAIAEFRRDGSDVLMHRDLLPSMAAVTGAVDARRALTGEQKEGA